MSQFAPWSRQRAALMDVVTTVAARARAATGTIPANAVGLAARTRSRCEQLPLAIVDELRRRVNVLDLATKQDVAVQSKLGRNRVSFVLKEFLDAQRDHDEALLESLRSELREELQSFAAAVDDNLFAVDEQSPSTDTRAPRRSRADVDYLPDADEIDLGDDDDIDLTGDEATIRRRGSR
jgi:hypothetical protein